MKAPDLTKQPPRSPRVRLGGVAILPRMLDKARALLAGTQGDYKFGCPLDQRCLDFLGVEAEALKKFVAGGQGDGAVLDWIKSQSKSYPDDASIAAWSTFEEQRAPSQLDSREYFHSTHQTIAPARTDLMTWFDLLDLDDYVSYGGVA
ncbi:MAG: DUF5069 domain-containing protein [Verrucomicrobia bacterium]|nr:DUF5069 domain-containing protein [Verrucomicrobiota bacterium]